MYTRLSLRVKCFLSISRKSWPLDIDIYDFHYNFKPTEQTEKIFKRLATSTKWKSSKFYHLGDKEPEESSENHYKKSQVGKLKLKPFVTVLDSRKHILLLQKNHDDTHYIVYSTLLGQQESQILDISWKLFYFAFI